jgi:hypothetical protein
MNVHLLTHKHTHVLQYKMENKQIRLPALAVVAVVIQNRVYTNPSIYRHQHEYHHIHLIALFVNVYCCCKYIHHPSIYQKFVLAKYCQFIFHYFPIFDRMSS